MAKPAAGDRRHRDGLPQRRDRAPRPDTRRCDTNQRAAAATRTRARRHPRRARRDSPSGDLGATQNDPQGSWRYVRLAIGLRESSRGQRQRCPLAEPVSWGLGPTALRSPEGNRHARRTPLNACRSHTSVIGTPDQPRRYGSTFRCSVDEAYGATARSALSRRAPATGS